MAPTKPRQRSPQLPQPARAVAGNFLRSTPQTKEQKVGTKKERNRARRETSSPPSPIRKYPPIINIHPGALVAGDRIAGKAYALRTFRLRFFDLEYEHSGRYVWCICSRRFGRQHLTS